MRAHAHADRGRTTCSTRWPTAAGSTFFASETFRLVRGELGPATVPDGREDDLFAGIRE